MSAAITVIFTEGTVEVVLSWICGGAVWGVWKWRRFIGGFFFFLLFIFLEQTLDYSSCHKRFREEFLRHRHTQGHLSFTSPWPSAGWSLQHRWNRETKYFSKLQEKTFWHAWNLPENCIKIKSGELRVPHQHERSRHLYIFRVAGSTIKKLWVCGIKDGGWGMSGLRSGSAGSEKGQITYLVMHYMCLQTCMMECEALLSCLWFCPSPAASIWNHISYRYH